MDGQQKGWTKEIRMGDFVLEKKRERGHKNDNRVYFNPSIFCWHDFGQLGQPGIQRNTALKKQTNKQI